MNDAKKKMGRPTDYTPELADEICDVIACANKGIQRLCKQYAHWPEPMTIYRWIRKYPDFCYNYAKAKEFQAEIGVDEIIDIADDGALDYVINDKGQVIADKEHIQRSRLRVDTRKWAASKRLAKKYGDKIQAEIVGKDGQALTNVTHLTLDPIEASRIYQDAISNK